MIIDVREAQITSTIPECHWNVAGDVSIFTVQNLVYYIFTAQKMDVLHQDSVFVVANLWEARNGIRTMIDEVWVYIQPYSESGVYCFDEWYSGVIKRDIEYKEDYDYFFGFRAECKNEVSE